VQELFAKMEPVIAKELTKLLFESTTNAIMEKT